MPHRPDCGRGFLHRLACGASLVCSHVDARRRWAGGDRLGRHRL